MTDLIRPALYSAEHLVLPVRESDQPDIRQSVVGPVCESGDFLGKMSTIRYFLLFFNTRFTAKDVALPPCHAGDLLAVMDTGAYGASMARSDVYSLKLCHVDMVFLCTFLWSGRV